MINNLPKFTDTVGSIERSDTQFNGMADTRLYNDAERDRKIQIAPENRFWSDMSRAGILKQGDVE